MGIVPTNNMQVKALKGLHLYHAGISNCAMRVRMTLEEKGLPWVSHHIDITKKENLTEEYFSIHPKGLVPALVEDGVVIIESDDIIDHLDKTYPNPPLRPSDEKELETMYYWLHLAPEIHVKAVKTFIYIKRMQGKMSKSKEESELYQKLQKDPELLEFHGKVSSGAFTDADLAKAEGILQGHFSAADKRLSKSKYLIGDQFTLADIAWSPLYFTLKEMTDLDLNDYNHLCRWAADLEERPSYKKAILEWWPI
jgi:glutathione S-transferase